MYCEKEEIPLLSLNEQQSSLAKLVNGVYLKENGTFDVASFIGNSWSAGAPLEVSLTLNEDYEGLAQWYLVKKAELNLEYDNKVLPFPNHAPWHSSVSVCRAWLSTVSGV